ncbi:MAG: hypothetical protein ACFFD1_08650, partial [Candidatus Thorarchaeota archaeon]
DEELSVTSKSYVCTLLILYVMAKTIIGEFFNDASESEKVEYLIKELEKLLTTETEIARIWDELLLNFGYDLHFLEILARGASLTTAHQAALNFKEITKNYSEATSISSFRHGGIECLNDDTHLLLLTSDSKNLKLNKKFIHNILTNWKCRKLVHLTNQNLDDEIVNKNAKMIVYHHKITDPFLAPIMEIVILQLLFYRIAEKQGTEPGIFQFSRKVTDDI